MCYIIEHEGQIQHTADLPTAIQIARGLATEAAPVSIFQKVRVLEVERRVTVREVGLAVHVPQQAETTGQIKMGNFGGNEP